MIGLKESTSVTSLYREFSLSLSKALGCKRVHDDRFTGVTFEENASRNALIVNEEYAWVGNPFSALDKRVIINELSLVFLLRM